MKTHAPSIIIAERESIFRNSFSENIFNKKYRHEGAETWEELSRTLVYDVCGDLLSKEDCEDLIYLHSKMKWIAGGRYLYYAGRPSKYYNNCYLFKALEDSKEDWADLSWKHISALMTGGGIGTDYSIYREEGATLSKTGGVASGPISKMKMTNEEGREIQQGGSRRSAMFASLNWLHPDIFKFLHIKDWNNMPVAGTGGMTVGQLKEADFNFPAPLDMTNISVNYDNRFLEKIYKLPYKTLLNIYNEEGNEGISKLPVVYIPEEFKRNCYQALKTGEPGFSFNFFEKENETLRNACTEVTSSDDCDVCNLASLNFANIDSLEELNDVTTLVSKFLLCGTIKAHLPFNKIYKIREKNRRLGLGLMGVHEWLMKRGYRYGITPELKIWLQVYKEASEQSSKTTANYLNISKPIANRAIAPTGTIGIMASTTTGIEPLLAVAYKRRFLVGNKEWHYEFVVDGTARTLIQEYNLKPDDIETALDLSKDYKRRIEFQCDIQEFVDQGISSTINLPPWDSEGNNENMLDDFALEVAKNAHKLRGLTCYPDGSRGGQPMTPVSYNQALALEGKQFQEVFHDICDITGGGTCGL